MTVLTVGWHKQKRERGKERERAGERHEPESGREHGNERKESRARGIK